MNNKKRITRKQMERFLRFSSINLTVFLDSSVVSGFVFVSRNFQMVTEIKMTREEIRSMIVCFFMGSFLMNGWVNLKHEPIQFVIIQIPTWCLGSLVLFVREFVVG